MASNKFRLTFETWVGDAHNTSFHEEEEVSNIDIVAVKSSAERTKVIAAFKKHGITQLPDGRKVEDVVVVP